MPILIYLPSEPNVLGLSCVLRALHAKALHKDSPHTGNVGLSKSTQLYPSQGSAATYHFRPTHNCVLVRNVTQVDFLCASYRPHKTELKAQCMGRASRGSLFCNFSQNNHFWRSPVPQNQSLLLISAQATS